MKSIAFIMPNLGGGGAEKVLVDILNNINSSKYKITLILFEKKGIYLEKIPKYVKIIAIDEKFKFISSKIWLKILKYFPKFFYKLIINDKYDVEIAFMEGLPVQLVGSSNNLSSRKITWVHADLLNFHWTKKLFKYGEESELYDKFDDIIFVSNEAKLAFEKAFSKNKCKKKVIYNPIISDEIIKKSKEKNLSFNEFTLISVGRLISEKGYDMLIKVHSKLVKEYPHKLLILGEGVERKRLERLILELGVQDSVELKGFVKNPYVYIKAADLFISSSVTEGYSLVVCESIILEKPILSTNTAGPREILCNGKYGILCDNSEESMKNALKNILINRDLINKYKNKSIERKKAFDYKKIIYDIETLIDRKNI